MLPSTGFTVREPYITQGRPEPEPNMIGSVFPMKWKATMETPMPIFTTPVGRITAGLWCGLGLAVAAQGLRWAYLLS
jgi:hypothetical protein